MRAIIQIVCVLAVAAGVGLIVGGEYLPAEPYRQSDMKAMFVGWGAALLTLGILGILLTIINAILAIFSNRPTRP